jgi:hypothetical protein
LRTDVRYSIPVLTSTVKISDTMALTLGSKQRKTIPVPRIVVEAIANNLLIERVVPGNAIPIDKWRVRHPVRAVQLKTQNLKLAS